MSIKPPSIPSIPASSDSAIKRAVEALKAWATDISGKVASNDSVDSKVSSSSAAIAAQVAAATDKGTQGATYPTGVTAEGGFAGIVLRWTTFAAVYDHVEIWRSATNDLTAAELVGTSIIGAYVDKPPVGYTDTTYYYWIRFIGGNEVPSLFSAGVSAISWSSYEGVTVSGEQIFFFNAGESVPTSESITLTATISSTLTTYDWEYWDTTNSVWVNLSGTQNAATYALRYDNAAWLTASSLLVRCQSGAYSDEITIFKLRDSAAGLDAIAIIMPNATHAMPASSAGVVSDYSGSGTTITLYEGNNLLTYTATGTGIGEWTCTSTDAVGITAGSLTDSGTFLTVGAASAMTAILAKVVYQFTVTRFDGTVFYCSREQSFTQARAGVAGIVECYYQDAAPATAAEGALWFDTNDGNKLYTWRTDAWVVTQDTAITAAITAAQTAQSTADGKAVAYYQAGNPGVKTAADIGDIWIDTDDNNKLYVYANAGGTNGWVLAQDWYTSYTYAQSALSTAQGKIDSFYQASAPGSASEGDIWFDTDDGNKIYTRRSGVWVATQDSAIATAINNAQTAQSTADGKAVVYAQDTEPTGQTAADAGDMWVDTNDNKKLYVYSGTAWVLAQDWYTANAAAIAAQGTANTAAANATTALNSLTEIASDAKITQGEKQAIFLEWQAIYNEQAAIVAQATALGVATATIEAYYKTSTGKWQMLQTYLNSSPISMTNPPTDGAAWVGAAGTISITGADFRLHFSALYTARQALLNAIADKAATLATWGGVTGTGKPADNATANPATGGTYAQLLADTATVVGTFWRCTDAAGVAHSGETYYRIATGAAVNDAGLPAKWKLLSGDFYAENIVGTTITGKTLQTATSGQRVVMSGADNDLKVFNSSGTEIISLGVSGNAGSLVVTSPAAVYAILATNNSQYAATSYIYNASTHADAIAMDIISAGGKGVKITALTAQAKSALEVVASSTGNFASYGLKVTANSTNGYGIHSTVTGAGATAVYASATSDVGVYGYATSGSGIHGQATTGTGVLCEATGNGMPLRIVKSGSSGLPSYYPTYGGTFYVDSNGVLFYSAVDTWESLSKQALSLAVMNTWYAVSTVDMSGLLVIKDAGNGGVNVYTVTAYSYIDLISVGRITGLEIRMNMSNGTTEIRCTTGVIGVRYKWTELR